MRPHPRGCVAALLLAACAPPGVPDARLEDAPVGTWSTGSFEVALDGRRLELRRGERTLWASIPDRAFVTGWSAEARIGERRGSFTVDERRFTGCDAQWVAAAAETPEGVLVAGELECGGERHPYSLRLRELSPARLEFRLELETSQLNRVALVLAAPARHVFGGGEQFSLLDLAGARVPILVQEQGIGRGAFPITLGANLTAGAGGDFTSTYAAIPHLLTLDGRSLYLENTELAAFDLRDRSRLTVEAHALVLDGAFLVGDSPKDAVREYTAGVGRMRPLPDWILAGAVLGLQGGTDRVIGLRDQALQAGVVTSALWLQDWVGQRITSFGKQLWWNWELDQERYPRWPDLDQSNALLGLRTLTYVNPFLTPVTGLKPNARRDLFAEAEAAGHLVRRADGSTYLTQNTDFSAALVDLTSLGARDWFRQVITDEVIGAGADGWMADFGEALPFDAVLQDGRAEVEHNRYPVRWAQLNREALDAGPGRPDMVFFMRAAFTHSPRYATLFWEGDQLVSWDEFDGIKSAVTGLLSGGLSGMSLNHSDIGGYTAIDNPLQRHFRSKELFMRWAELAAFTPVFRTHEGNRPDDNHQFHSDAETLRHFARMSRVFSLLFSYRRELVDEAAATGLPVVRPMFLEFPHDPVAPYLTYQQFMFGEELLVVPALDPGVTRVRAYLPAGRWVHLWTRDVYGDPDRGSFHDVPAPLGEPPAFLREGSRLSPLIDDLAALPRLGN